MTETKDTTEPANPSTRGSEHGILVTDIDGNDHRITGEIVSAPGGRLNEILRDKSYELCALTEEGRLFLADGHRRNIHVESFIAAVKRMHEPLFEPFVVTDMSTIKAINEFGQRNRGSHQSDTVVETQTQRELSKIITEATRRGASDVHIIDKTDNAYINMRVNGAIQKMRDLQTPTARALMSAAHALSEESDPSYQELEPQSARIARTSKLIRLPPGVEAIRLQWDPLAYGGRMLVMRFLYSSVSSGRSSDISVENLGYHPKQTDQLRIMRARPSGVTIVSGPTGSGKSTTLKVALEELMRETKYEKNALTVEDPPEYPIAGVQQIPVTNVKTREERERKFQEAINAALRSDPDIIMIGEIRNRESAKLTFEAAMSGHQVFATLHANSALAIVDRLRDIGVEPYKLYDPTIMTGLVGQRLVPKLCPHCRISFSKAVRTNKVSRDVLMRINKFLDDSGARAGDMHVRGEGCSKCDKGHNEQVIATETIVPNETLMDLLRRELKADARAYWLNDMGGFSMLAHGISKMLAGEVSPEALEARVDTIAWDPHMKSILQPYIEPRPQEREAEQEHGS